MTVQQQPESSNIRVFFDGRIVIGKHELRKFADGQVRIRDLDAARDLGFKRPRKIRELVESTWPGLVGVERTPAPVSTAHGGNRHATNEYWLTEAQFLKVVARSRTPIADALLDEMIGVFLAVKRHMYELQLQTQYPPPSPNFKPPEQKRLPPKRRTAEQRLQDQIVAMQDASDRMLETEKSLESFRFFVGKVSEFLKQTERLVRSGKLQVTEVVYTRKGGRLVGDDRVMDHVGLYLMGLDGKTLVEPPGSKLEAKATKLID